MSECCLLGLEITAYPWATRVTEGWRHWERKNNCVIPTPSSWCSDLDSCFSSSILIMPLTLGSLCAGYKFNELMKSIDQSLWYPNLFMDSWLQQLLRQPWLVLAVSRITSFISNRCLWKPEQTLHAVGDKVAVVCSQRRCGFRTQQPDLALAPTFVSQL